MEIDIVSELMQKSPQRLVVVITWNTAEHKIRQNI